MCFGIVVLAPDMAGQVGDNRAAHGAGGGGWPGGPAGAPPLMRAVRPAAGAMLGAMHAAATPTMGAPAARFKSALALHICFSTREAALRPQNDKTL